MAAGWLHQMHDIVVFGQAYLDIHRAKDAHAQKVPGKRHREVGHDWYQRFGEAWDSSNPFPEVVNQRVRDLGLAEGPDTAERLQVDLAHDCLDKTWDDLPNDSREYWEGFFTFLIYRPDVLRLWAGVDVIGGRVRRSHNGHDVWEDCPEVIQQYKRLRREVSRHWRSRLRSVLLLYGQ